MSYDVEINSAEDLKRFIESASRDELEILKYDIQQIQKELEEEEGSSGGRTFTLKRPR